MHGHNTSIRVARVARVGGIGAGHIAAGYFSGVYQSEGMVSRLFSVFLAVGGEVKCKGRAQFDHS